MSNSVVDVAEYMLSLAGEMPAAKLQSLLYLGQANSLATLGQPLFDEEIQAWAEGPIVPALYELHKDVDTVAPGFFYEKLRELRAGLPTQETPSDVNTMKDES